MLCQKKIILRNDIKSVIRDNLTCYGSMKLRFSVISPLANSLRVGISRNLPIDSAFNLDEKTPLPFSMLV